MIMEWSLLRKKKKKKKCKRNTTLFSFQQQKEQQERENQTKAKRDIFRSLFTLGLCIDGDMWKQKL